MAKTAVGIETFLLNDHLIREERHRDLALGGVAGNERRDVPDNGGFADRLADIWITAARHPLAIELNFEFVMTQRQHAKVVAAVLIDAVNLSCGDRTSRRLAKSVGRND